MNTFVHDDTVWAQNNDGTWSEAIPLPYRRSFIRKACCACGEGFFLTSSYEWHYRSHHTDGLAYIRKPEGFLTSYRLCRGIYKELPESLVYRGPAPKDKEQTNDQL